MLDSRSKKLVSLLFAVVILLSCVVVYQFVEPQEVKGEEHQVLGLSVSPSGSTFKLGVNQSKTFTASALNGTGPYDFSWFIYPSEDSDFYLTVNGEKCHVNDYINYMKIDGESLTLCFPEATEDFVSIVLSGVDANGLQGHSESFIVADPYTSSGYYFDGSQAVYSYKVSSDGLGWYRVYGSNGAALTAYDGTNSTLVTDALLGDMTSGALFLDGVAFDLDLLSSIPEDVRVICLYEDEYFEYINNADSSGSPYTVSVGSGVNNGYYLAQDSEGRICYIDDDVYDFFTALLVVSPSHIKIDSGTYPVDTQIDLKSNLLLEADKNAKFTTTISTSLKAVFEVHEKQNVTLRGLNIEGGTTQKTNGVKGLGFSKSAHITVDNCVITGFQYGIFTSDMFAWRIDNLVVSNCVFTDLRYNALNLLDVNNSKIINNYIFNTGQSGIAGYLSNSVIDGNTIVNPGQLEQYYGGMTIMNPRADSEYMQNLVISNNAVHFTTEPPYIVNGIVISAENAFSSYVDGVTITGNTIFCYTNHTNFNVGIYLHMRMAPSALINIRNVAITGNTVTNMKYGCLLMGECITFSGNSIYNACVGVWNSGSAIGAGVSTFNVNGNIIKGIDTLTNYDGIRVTGTGARSIIASNFIEYFSMGITEEYTGYGNADYSFITSNYIQNCTTTINVVGSNTNSTSNFTP